MKKISKKYVNIILVRGGDVNNTLYINKEVIKNYEIASFSTSNFS